MPGFPSVNDVRERVKRMRADGTLTKAVRSGSVAYTLDDNHPGKIVALYKDGRRELGEWKEGRFVAIKALSAPDNKKQNNF